MDTRTFEGGGCTHYLDYGDGFTDADMCQSSSHCIFLMCFIYSVSIIPQQSWRKNRMVCRS